MRVVNNDAASYQSNALEKCLDTTERKKKRKYLTTCLTKRRQLTPFVASVNGLLVVKVEAMLKSNTSCLAQTW